MGSKTPTSKFSGSKEFKWGPVARKSPIDEGFYSVVDEQSLSTD